MHYIDEAAINAVKMGREFVSQKDLFDAVEQVLVGKEKKDRIMSKEERNVCSRYSLPPPYLESRLLPIASISSMKTIQGASARKRCTHG